MKKKKEILAIGLLSFILIFGLSFSGFNSVQQTGIDLELKAGNIEGKLNIDEGSEDLIKDVTYSFLIAFVISLSIVSFTIIKLKSSKNAKSKLRKIN